MCSPITSKILAGSKSLNLLQRTIDVSCDTDREQGNRAAPAGTVGVVSDPLRESSGTVASEGAGTPKEQVLPTISQATEPLGTDTSGNRALEVCDDPAALPTGRPHRAGRPDAPMTEGETGFARFGHMSSVRGAPAGLSGRRTREARRLPGGGGQHEY